MTDTERIDQLRAAGKRLLEAYYSLLPGIKYIALQDYQIINEAPLEMKAAIGEEVNDG